MVFFLDLLSLVAAIVATLALNVASFVCRCIHRRTSSIWWFIHQTISPMLVASFLSVLGWVLLPMQPVFVLAKGPCPTVWYAPAKPRHHPKLLPWEKGCMLKKSKGPGKVVPVDAEVCWSPVDSTD